MKRNKLITLILSTCFVFNVNTSVLAYELEEVDQSLPVEEETIIHDEKVEDIENSDVNAKENSVQYLSLDNSEVSNEDDKNFYDIDRVTGWKRSEGKWIFFDEQGNKVTNQELSIDGTNYRLDSKGLMITGWYQDSQTNWFHYSSSGAMTTGWILLDNKWYFFNEKGSMITGWQEIDEDDWYYFDSNGHMETGWQEINNLWYYFNSNGRMQTEWILSNNSWYYLDQNGYMVTGWKKVDDTWYYLNPSGRMAKGWLELDNSWYYLLSDGSMVTNSYNINNVTNFFSLSGRWQGNWVKTSKGTQYKYPTGQYATSKWKYIDDNWYYFNDKSFMATGWQKVNGRWYYLKSNGVMATEWITVGTNKYYLNQNGEMLTGWIELNNNWYYLKNDGSMTVGEYKIWDKINVFSSNGVWNGSWEKNYKGWWFKYPNNNYPSNSWQKINNKWYHFNKSGYITTGWIKSNNYWYFMKSDGAMITGEHNIGGRLHQFSSSGVWLGTWNKNNIGWWYSYPNKKYPKNAWVSINNKWYYFRANGSMLSESKTKIDVSYYDKTLREAVNIQLDLKAARPQTDARPGWKDASRNDVEYYINPTNFLQYRPYQFLKLSGSSNISLAEINAELIGKGILAGRGQAFLNGGREYNINEIYLLAHALLETGHGKSTLATGVKVETKDGTKTVYNMFGIGASDSDPVKLGAQRALEEGWFTPELAIEGGAKWIAGNYINHPTLQQDTLYKMRWNPKNPGVHQYATDVGWAYKQTRVMDLIAEISERNNGIILNFDVPIYESNLVK